MAGTVYDWYGYDVNDTSTVATAAAAGNLCPGVPGPCTKVTNLGGCAVESSKQQVIICPKRLYFDGHRFLREIAARAFQTFGVALGPDGLPSLVKGSAVRHHAQTNGVAQVGVFGHEWDGEIKLPPAKQGSRTRYSVDFTLVVVDATGALVAFVPIEVQSIDTTGSYQPSLAALRNGRKIVTSTVGLNWENVNKRILPQLITKGQILQGEPLCTKGLFFVTPEPVYDKIMDRLGGPSHFRHVPLQSGSITFVSYAYTATPAGQPIDLVPRPPVTITTSDMAQAFISPQYLPPTGSYEKLIKEKL